MSNVNTKRMMGRERNTRKNKEKRVRARQSYKGYLVLATLTKFVLNDKICTKYFVGIVQKCMPSN